MKAPALWPLDFCRKARAAGAFCTGPGFNGFFPGGYVVRKVTGANVATGAGPACACCGVVIPPRTEALWVNRDAPNLWTPTRRYLHLEDCSPESST